MLVKSALLKCFKQKSTFCVSEGLEHQYSSRKFNQIKFAKVGCCPQTQWEDDRRMLEAWLARLSLSDTSAFQTQADRLAMSAWLEELIMMGDMDAALGSQVIHCN